MASLLRARSDRAAQVHARHKVALFWQQQPRATAAHAARPCALHSAACNQTGRSLCTCRSKHTSVHPGARLFASTATRTPCSSGAPIYTFTRLHIGRRCCGWPLTSHCCFRGTGAGAEHAHMASPILKRSGRRLSTFHGELVGGSCASFLRRCFHSSSALTGLPSSASAAHSAPSGEASPPPPRAPPPSERVCSVGASRNVSEARAQPSQGQTAQAEAAASAASASQRLWDMLVPERSMGLKSPSFWVLAALCVGLHLYNNHRDRQRDRGGVEEAQEEDRRLEAELRRKGRILQS
eukprot:GHVT01055004.1.p1 GENE.GHVT01055004.1~~GHVT01055004.1.p1  ORF type:complete len:295 (+),score=53.86 GHVT01055004.1:332-1216(+)